MPFGINWKTVGLICGACAAPFTGGTSLLAACAACGGAGLVAGHFLDRQEKKDKTKKEKLDLKGKSVETIITDNKQAQQESDEWKKKYEQQERENKKLEEETRSISDKLKDPNLTPEEKEELKNRLAFLQTQLDEGKNKSQSILDTIKGLGERIKKNNKIISDSASNLNDSHWIWEFITLENILIMGGCYFLYQLLKEEKRK